jgi:rubredoxin-NAD+ reductase
LYLASDLVLSAIGLRPNITLAESAGLPVNRGIVVDRYLATRDPSIFALGDCAEVEGHVLTYITPILNAARALAKTLANQKTAVEYPAMPVVVKTPAHPLVLCPPPKGMPGNWQIDYTEKGVRALFYNDAHILHGFVLTNGVVNERQHWVNSIPRFF